MANFNDLPLEASPLSTDNAFIARGSLSGAERKSTISSILTLITSITGSISGTPTWLGANIWSAVGRFNAGLGINALPSSSTMDPTTPLYLSRTDASGAGVKLAAHSSYEAAFINTQVGSAGLFDVINTGSATGGSGHLLGVIGRVQDTTSGALPQYGVEGKTVRKGASDNDSAVWGISDYDGSTYTGRQRDVFSGFCEIYNGTIATPVTEGATCIFRAINGTGGDPTQRFALKGDALMKIRTGGDSTYIQMEHDGTDGKLAITTGALRLYAPSNYIVLQDGLGFVPLTSGSSLGINGFRWQGSLSSGTNISLSSSVTPSNNGDLMFQATSDTSLTFKYKGSDGTVRSGSITLS